MKISELQIGDWVSCLGDPVRVVSLSLKDDEPIGIMSPLKTIETFREEDVKPLPLTSKILLANGFEFDEEVKRGYVLYLDEGKTWYVAVSLRYNDEPRMTEISFERCGVVKPIQYVHELQHALRLVGLNDLARNLKI